MSKKDKKVCKCYRCSREIVGIKNIAGWDKMRWLAHPEWPERLMPICGDCSYKDAVYKVNELYTGDDEVNFWRHEAMGC